MTTAARASFYNTPVMFAVSITPRPWARVLFATDEPSARLRVHAAQLRRTLAVDPATPGT